MRFPKQIREIATATARVTLGRARWHRAYREQMRHRTRLDVDEWWRGVFGVEAELWSAVTVRHPHGQLGDYGGSQLAVRRGSFGA